MTHILHDREDELRHCKVCQGAEGTLPTDCPGYRIPDPMQMLVWDGKIDFVVDQWIEKAAKVKGVWEDSNNEDEEAI